MNRKYIVPGLLLVIPTIVLLAVPAYNRENPQLLGLPFFYWFQGVWLGIAALFYVIAGVMVTSQLKEGDPE